MNNELRFEYCVNKFITLIDVVVASTNFMMLLMWRMLLLSSFFFVCVRLAFYHTPSKWIAQWWTIVYADWIEYETDANHFYASKSAHFIWIMVQFHFVFSYTYLLHPFHSAHCLSRPYSKQPLWKTENGRPSDAAQQTPLTNDWFNIARKPSLSRQPFRFLPSGQWIHFICVLFVQRQKEIECRLLCTFECLLDNVDM